MTELIDQNRENKNEKSMEHLMNGLVKDGSKTVEMDKLKVYATSQKTQKSVSFNLLLVVYFEECQEQRWNCYEVDRKVCTE